MEIYPAFINTVIGDNSVKFAISIKDFSDFDKFDLCLVKLNKTENKLIELDRINLANDYYQIKKHSEVANIEFNIPATFFEEDTSTGNLWALKIEPKSLSKDISSNYAIYIPVFVASKESIESLSKDPDNLNFSISCQNRILFLNFENNLRCRYSIDNQSDVALRYKLNISLKSGLDGKVTRIIDEGDLGDLILPHESIEQSFNINIKDTRFFKNNLSGSVILSNDLLNTPIILKENLSIFAFGLTFYLIIISIIVSLIIRVLFRKRKNNFKLSLLWQKSKKKK